MLRFLKIHLVVILLSLVFFINLISLLYFPDPLFQLKKNLFSLSAGQSYSSRLSLINYFALSGDWQLAETLALKTDPADTALIFSTLNPNYLKNSLNQLVFKSNKTADDYVKIAKIQFELGQSSQSLESLNQARKTDPIREDLQALYYQFQKQLN
jgi:hypothetical protein